MELSELKLITASNIINLRTAAGMTQSELGAELNYSDKNISKWERGESVPDALALHKIAGLFGVTVDYLLSSNDQWQPIRDEDEEEEIYSKPMIIALVMLGIWTLFLTAFIILWIAGMIWWKIFLVALPTSLLTLIIMFSAFNYKHLLQYSIAAFVLSLFMVLYFFFPGRNPWQIFILAVPALTIVFISCNIRKTPGKLRKIKNKFK